MTGSASACPPNTHPHRVIPDPNETSPTSEQASACRKLLRWTNAGPEDRDAPAIADRSGVLRGRPRRCCAGETRATWCSRSGRIIGSPPRPSVTTCRGGRTYADTHINIQVTNTPTRSSSRHTFRRQFARCTRPSSQPGSRHDERANSHAVIPTLRTHVRTLSGRATCDKQGRKSPPREGCC